MPSFFLLRLLFETIKILIVFDAMQILDVLYKIAMVLIAITNFCFAFFVFFFKNRKDDQDKERDRQISWAKSLVLDYTLDSFYKFFEDVADILKRLQESELQDKDKSDIDVQVANKFILLRQNFIDPLTSASNELANLIQERSDQLQATLTNNIFNLDNDFSNDTIYQDLILNSLSAMKVDTLRAIFNYRGDIVNNSGRRRLV